MCAHPIIVCWISVIKEVLNEIHWLFELQKEAVISAEMMSMKVYQKECGYIGRKNIIVSGKV